MINTNSDRKGGAWEFICFCLREVPPLGERAAEFKEIVEDARYVTVRTQPILDIIYEEAGGFCRGEEY